MTSSGRPRSIRLDFEWQRYPSLLLRSRKLAGGGFRLKILPRHENMQFDMETGVMYEGEQYYSDHLTPEEKPSSSLTRWTNMMTYKFIIEESFGWANTFYYQPSFRNFSDFRLLGQVMLILMLEDRLFVHLTGEWRHDSQPPGNLQRNDFQLKVGTQIRF